MTFGSIEGLGKLDLSYRSIVVGSNHLDTTFSGIISGFGSLTKTGHGRLILAGASTYTSVNHRRAATIVSQGTLLVNNTSGSGTGTGSVLVRGGTLGGTGTIAGSVQVGNDRGSGAILSPGDSKNPPASLTIESNLSFVSDATLHTRMNSNNGSAGAFVANAVTISGAQIFISDAGNTALPPGTVFTAISNTAATPISGTFTNLADGGTITVGSNTFQANYEGGDGNDLTLTVIP